jgi:hypothetical protein
VVAEKKVYLVISDEREGPKGLNVYIDLEELVGGLKEV